MTIELNGKGANAQTISRSVAKDTSKQVFTPIIIARADSKGHVECDSIIMDQGKVSSTPAITAEHPDAQLTHEAAIGRIAEEQLLKLMTLGLTAEEAEDVILRVFSNEGTTCNDLVVIGQKLYNKTWEWWECLISVQREKYLSLLLVLIIQ